MNADCLNITAMRADRAAFRLAVTLLRDEGAALTRLPVATWAGREYVVLVPPSLTPHPQEVQVIDLTGFDEIDHEPSRAARFGTSWPELHFPTRAGETDLE